MDINYREAISEWTGEDRLHDLISHHYGLTIRKARPVSGVLKVKTDKGSYALKRVRQGEKNRWKMLLELKDYLDELGSDMTQAFPVTTSSEKPFFRGFRFSYVLLPWIKGKPMNTKSIDNYTRATTELAHFHQATKDFGPTGSYRELNKIGKWSSQWEKETQLSEIFHLAAKWTKMPTKADRFWLRTASYTTSLLENLLEYFQKIGGDKVCKETSEHAKVCHGNLHGSNILETKEGKLHFVDYNDAVLDVRTHDLAKWLSYAYGQTGSKNILKVILKSYQEIAPLKEEEYPLIYARFLYPERLIRKIEAVYEKDEQENLDTSAAIIKSLAKAEEKKAVLFDAFSEVVKEEYDITIPVLDWMHKAV